MSKTLKKLDHALSLAELGFRVFPLTPGRKTPPKDFAWKEEATRDAARIKEWWGADPAFNIGVAMGQGTIVVDADTKKDKPGLASLETLDLLGLPQSFRVKTPSGGLHVYLRVEKQHNNRVDSIPDYPGIDIRSDDGYVLGPGSIIDGKTYEALPGAIEPAGEWLEDILLKNAPSHTIAKTKDPVVELDLPEHVSLAIEYLTQRAPEAVEGAGGNETTYRVAAQCRDYGLSPDTTFDLMLEHWNEQKAFPAWLPADLQTVVGNAYKYATGEWGGRTAVADFEAVDIDVGEPPAEADNQNEVWPDPVDLWAKFPPPELPRGLLPKVIEDFAFAQAELMGADPGGLAASALAVCAAAISDDIRIRVKRHSTEWQESARIWVALVGEPSTKKSPIINAASRPLRRIDSELVPKYLREKQAWDLLKREEQKTQPPPVQRRCLLQDVTVEAASEVLKDNPQGLLCLQDELSGWFGSIEKYGGRGSGKDRAFWLQAFNGGPSTTNRIGRGVTFVSNLSVSMLGGVQPDAIRRQAQGGVDDGLLQRLFPIVLRPASVGVDKPMPPAADAYRAMVLALRQISTSDDGEIADFEPALLFFSEGGQAIRDELEHHHLALMAAESISGKLASHIGKLDGLFARLCILWHAVEHSAAGLMPREVSTDTAARVAAFMKRFLLRHALSFYADTLGFSQEQDLLTAAAGYVLAHSEKRTIAWRDIGPRGPRVLRSVDSRDGQRLLEKLEFLGWLRAASTGTALRWTVNPKVHSLFADQARAEAERRVRAQEAFSAMGGA